MVTLKFHGMHPAQSITLRSSPSTPGTDAVAFELESYWPSMIVTGPD